jgi:hypothetical protein
LGIGRSTDSHSGARRKTLKAVIEAPALPAARECTGRKKEEDGEEEEVVVVVVEEEG